MKKFNFSYFILFFLIFNINLYSNDLQNESFNNNLNNSSKTSSNGYPKMIEEYVNDFSNILKPSNKEEITKILKHVNQQTGILVVVAVINSVRDYDITDFSFESFATNLFNEWRIGDKKKNNGVLFLISIDDRKVRIELGKGYGRHYDAAMKEVIDNKIIPSFKHEDYNMGIYKGVLGIKDNLTKEVSWLKYHLTEIILGILFFVCIIAGFSCIKSGKKGWGYAFFAAAGVILLFLIKAFLSGNRGSGSSFTGGGGGSSFGGGASGSW